MASGITRPLTRSIKGRMFSAAAAQADAKGADDKEPRAYVKKLSNGMLVGSVESQSPVARLAVVANAGSRYESGENIGIAHFLRHAGKFRTQNLSSLGIARQSLQLGSDITCQGTREYLYYKGSVTRNCAGKVVEVLREITTKHVFKQWEVSDAQSDPTGIALELALLKQQPHVRVVENLHAAAFRDTLGRSLYAPDYAVGSFSPDQLMQYVKTFFSAGRLALVGVGIDHNELEELAAEFEPYGSAGVPVQKATYQGGEIRENGGGDLSYVAFAFGGPRAIFKGKRDKTKKESSNEQKLSLGQSSKDLLPAEVLKHIMGVGPHIKYSAGTSVAQLGKAVAQVTDSAFAVSCLNANYSDAGLFGFTAIAPSAQADQVVRAAAKQFKTALSNGVSDQDVSRAKNQLKAELAMQFESPDVLLGWLGEQTLNSDHILTPNEIYKMVDSVTTSDVNNIAKQIAATKPSMAASGNTNNVPYLDRLFS